MTLDEFVKKYNGGQWDWDQHYGAQCTDLFRLYCRDVLGIEQPGGVVGAKDFWGNYETDPVLKEHFEKHKNTPNAVPKKGDVVIWNGRVGKGFGHVAIFLMGGAYKFTSLDQNWYGKLTTKKVTHDYKNVSGWLRPRVSPSEPPTDTFSPSKALPSSWYKIDEAKDAIKRGLIAEGDAWDTTLSKFIELDKELNKQKNWFDEETEKLIEQHKEEVKELTARHQQNTRGYEMRLASCEREKEMPKENTKRVWESKTFWVNVIAVAAIVLQTVTGNEIIDSEVQAGILGIINLALRLITKKELVWKK